MKRVLPLLLAPLAQLIDRVPGYVLPETVLTEVASAYTACGWSFLLSLPVHLFASNISFLGLSHMGHEHKWLYSMATLAVLNLSGLMTRRPFLRWAGLMLGVFMWTFISRGIFATAPTWHFVAINTGLTVYPFMAVLDGICAISIFPYAVADFSFWAAHRRAKHLLARTEKKITTSEQKEAEGIK